MKELFEWLRTEKEELFYQGGDPPVIRRNLEEARLLS